MPARTKNYKLIFYIKQKKLQENPFVKKLIKKKMLLKNNMKKERKALD